MAEQLPVSSEAGTNEPQGQDTQSGHSNVWVSLPTAGNSSSYLSTSAAGPLQDTPAYDLAAYRT